MIVSIVRIPIMIELMNKPRIYDREASERILKVMKMKPRRIYTGYSLYGINSDDLEIDPEVLELSYDPAKSDS